jgi:hypothetical protein
MTATERRTPNTKRISFRTHSPKPRLVGIFGLQANAAMFLSEFDRSRRLLKVTVAGDTTAEEARAHLENLRTLLKDVQPGFRLLADLSAVASMPTNAAPYIGQVMEWCDKKGVGLVVRLLPSDPGKDIGLAIMSRFHYAPDVPIVTCATMEEAMRHLEDEKSEL